MYLLTNCTTVRIRRLASTPSGFSSPPGFRASSNAPSIVSDTPSPSTIVTVIWQPEESAWEYLFSQFRGILRNERRGLTRSSIWNYGFDVQYKKAMVWVCHQCVKLKRTPPRLQTYIPTNPANIRDHLFSAHKISTDDKVACRAQKKLMRNTVQHGMSVVDRLITPQLQ